MSLELALVTLAAEEGRHFALTEAQNWQSCLETMGETGNPAERRAAGILLTSVNGAIKTILAGQATAIAAGALRA